MAIIPKFFNDAVVAIGIRQDFVINWIATGFVVARENENGGYNTFLVSNKHVFKGKKSIVVRFNLKDEITARDYDILLQNDDAKLLYSEHNISNVDVACVLINPNVLEKELGQINAFALNMVALSYDKMLENEVIEGSLVYSLGFPSGLVGINSKLPLCRLGCIARIQELVNERGFLVDIQNFPGSSGSPLINRLEIASLTGTKSFTSTCLIGIISAYIPYCDALISRQTGEIMQTTRENSGLAIAYTVDAIQEVVEIEFNRVKLLESDLIVESDEKPIIE